MPTRLIAANVLVLLLVALVSASAAAQYDRNLEHVPQALFIRDLDAPSPHDEHGRREGGLIDHTSDRVPRQSAGGSPPSSNPNGNMDQTVQGILEWLQGKYVDGPRKARQQQSEALPSRDYLPGVASPTTTQRPRPFQTYTGSTGYPYPSQPDPTFNLPQSPATYSPPSQGPTVTPNSLPNPTVSSYSPSTSPQPQPAYPTDSGPSQVPFIPSTGYSNGGNGYSTMGNNGYSIANNGYSTGSAGNSGYSTGSSAGSAGNSGYSTGSAGNSGYSTGSSAGSVGNSGYSTGSAGNSGYSTGSSVGSGFSSSVGTASPTGGSNSFQPVDNSIDSSSDESHPPHIHAINVQCAKEMMKIDIEFNRAFNGIIYSKGYYNNPECRYVSQNSGQTRFSLTVQLNSCGTQFVDQFSEGKQAYLENVLVLQNEPGIQEVGVASLPNPNPVWDTIRSVRCLWEGSLNKALSVALTVGMLTQEIVTFSGDTATAKLDIQMGRGPYAPAASGLVKIGEPMTLVVTVEGDPGFNVLVRQCVARDNQPDSGNVVQLTDERGCVVKSKLMGAFQTTRNPDTNAVIAYAFFQAFKFPDVMDLTIECNVELCKTECAPCSDPGQKLEPGRRKRSVDNSTLELTDPVTVGRNLRVFLPQDIEQSGPSPAMIINVGSAASSADAVCLSSSVFLISSTLLLTILGVSCVTSAVLWLKLQHPTIRK